MEASELEELRYPIGKAQIERGISEARRRELVAQIAEAPARLRAAVAGLSDAQLETPYRPGGWTVRQLVHHVADSHINSYVRFRLALTEEEPPIKTYEEKLWATLPDAATSPIEVSLALLDALHDRWGRLLESMTPQQWRRSLRHPEWGPIDLDATLQIYAWHGRHHTAHVERLRQREGWV